MTLPSEVCALTLFSPHPPYSPHSAPSDFHLLGALKDALRRRRFDDDDGVREDFRRYSKVLGYRYTASDAKVKKGVLTMKETLG